MTWFRRSAHLEDELSAYVDGELGSRARRAVEKHLASCEECSTLLQELQDTKSLLRELPEGRPSRALTLGPEFAAEPKAVPARRSSFTFAPAAVALSVFVALVFVDAIDTNGGSQDDAFSANTTVASRAANQAEAGALAGDPTKALGEGPSLDAAAPTQDGAGLTPGPEVPSAAAAAPADDSTPPAAAGGGQDLPSPESALIPRATELQADDQADDDAAIGPPEETSQAARADDSSDGPSTLRILQIAAAIAFLASLVVMFLPRISRRQEGNRTR